MIEFYVRDGLTSVNSLRLWTKIIIDLIIMDYIICFGMIYMKFGFIFINKDLRLYLDMRRVLHDKFWILFMIILHAC